MMDILDLKQLRHLHQEFKMKRYLILGLLLICSVAFAKQFYEDVNIIGNLTLSGTVDGRDIDADGTNLDPLVTNGLSALTSAEVDQLENIGTETISNVQWAFVGLFDQGLAMADNVTFGQITGTLQTAAQTNITSVGVQTVLAVDDEITMLQISTPSNPAAGDNKVYFKSDDKLYSLTSGGVETEIGATSAVVNSALTLENIGFNVSSDDPTSGDATINYTQSDGSADATALNPIKVGFDQIDGTFDIVSHTSSLSVVIPSGAILGHSDAAAAAVYIYVIDAGGTLEGAVSSSLKDETILHTTTTISAGSDAHNLYSTTSRSNVPIRLVGKWISTQATAGDWALATGDKSTNPENIKSFDSDFFEINMGFSGYTVTANVYVDASEEIDLTPGEWDLGYDLSIQIDQGSGENGRMNVAIRVGSVTVANTTGLVMWSNHATTDTNGYSISRSTRVTVTDTTTYKISIRGSQIGTTARGRIIGEDITGALTNPDNASIFWARRVK